MIDIDKAFEGRWRFLTGNIIAHHREQEPITQEMLRKLCRDFFEAGIILATDATVTASTESENFDTFWNLYDKKVGRDKCLRLWNKLSAADKQACLDYIPLYKQAQPTKQYRKNPETFLRNKSWNDEIIYRTNGKPTATDLADKAARILQD